MDVGDTTLSQEQYRWVDDWLRLWGAWVYSGRLEKRISSLIARLMEAADPTRAIPSRPMCNDDDGLLISQVVDRVLIDDEKALGILLSYYAFGSSKRAIACYQFSTAKPRKVMLGRGYEGWRKPSLATCRREVDQVLYTSLCLIYKELYPAITFRKRVIKIGSRGGACR